MDSLKNKDNNNANSKYDANTNFDEDNYDQNKNYEEDVNYDENENYDQMQQDVNIDENDNFDGNDDFDGNDNFDDNDNFDENELELDTDNDANLDFDDEPSTSYTHLQFIVNTYSAYMYDSPASLGPSGIINVNLPTYFLPLSLQAVYGFSNNPNILNIELELNNQDWSIPPTNITIQHPTLQSNFVGRSLIMNCVDRFFSKEYKPRPFYRSESYLLYPTGKSDPKKKEILIKESFDAKSAERALIICSNNINQAREFLCTGLLPSHDSILSIEYSSCPLLFLILEFADCFLNLQDHCCICGDEMEQGLKPSVCDRPLCNFQLNQIGLGSSVVQEIQRDPLAADLMVSLYSAAYETNFLTPGPPEYFPPSCIQKLQSMSRMKEYTSDSQLSQAITPSAFNLLRWILLSNRSQLISLPKQYELPEFRGAFQFMTLISTPESESVFKELKNRNESMFLWHGSNGARWHSIIRNGLKNMSNTKMMANGAALGPGIYMARSSEISWGYSQVVKNNYVKSHLGKELHIIGLCEVAKVKDGSLKDHGWAHTLTREEACVVRFLFVNKSTSGCNDVYGGRCLRIPFNVDVIDNPPTKVPTLRDLLNYMSGHK